jgi:HAD superfamily hydrolase (TIGR01484 family)
MRPLAEMPADTCRQLSGLLCDLDDTMTTGGKLVPRAYDALWRAHEAGLRTVVVTGRPAGWVDHLARMWPVDAVVGENGAFYFHMDAGKMRRRWVDDEATRAGHRARLAELGLRIPKVVPGAALSADQFCRAADVAIDFCEDVPPLPAAAVDLIVAELQGAGATAKVSSIHVNGWFGVHDKLSCTRLLARERWGEDLDATRERYVFCGDSPNDEPMFAFFPNATAVANVVELVHRMAHRPAYVTPSRGGAGFAELVDHILAEREPGARLSSPSWCWS